MRFTPTSFFTSIAQGAFKYVQRKMYVKKTSSLSDALTAGTWLEVTDFVTSASEPHLALEFTIGQPRRDTISVTAKGITWWRANVFNASASEYIELKWVWKLGLSESKLASDIVYAFAGFVRKDTVEESEREDTVKFQVCTVEEEGNRIAAEDMATQFINPNIDGSGTDGLVMPQIPGVFVTNANIASYVLKAGVHTITYDNNGGSPQAQLDDGGMTALNTPGTTVLVNGAADQKIELRIISASAIYGGSDQRTTELIVKTAGDTLPYQWYYGVSVRSLLNVIYGQLGISTTTFDSLIFNTYDGSTKVSFLDIPPANAAVQGTRLAIKVKPDGSVLWVGVGPKLYERNMTTNVYTLKATVDASASEINRIIYNARNNELWLTYRIVSAGYVKVLHLGDDTLTSAASIGTPINAQCVQVFDYNYTGSSYEYCMLVARDDTSKIVHIYEDAGVLLSTDLFDLTTLKYDGVNLYTAAYMAGPSMKRGADKFYFFIREDAVITAGCYLHYVAFEDPGGGWAWQDKFSPYILADLDFLPEQIQAVAHDADDLWYYWYPDGTLRRLTFTANTETNVTTGLTDPRGLIYEPETEKVYYTITATKYLYRVSGTTPTQIGSGVNFSDTQVQTSQLTATTAGVVYGIEIGGSDLGRLWQCHTTLVMYVLNATYTGQTMHEALVNTLNSFLLLGKIATVKEGRVYRRTNDSGAAVTSGNSITLNTTKARALVKRLKSMPAFDWVSVSNGLVTYSYDGATFNANAFVDARKFELVQQYIPSEIVQDLAYYLYQYLSVDRSVYEIPTAMVPEFQYEPTDGAAVSFASSKIADNVTGLIVGQTLHQRGAVTFEVLSPL